MAERTKRMLPARGPELNPNDVKIGLAWTVYSDGQVGNVQSTPPSSGGWKIGEFCENNGVTLVAGEYEITGDLDGNIEVKSLPLGIGDDGRRKLTRAFGGALQRDAIELSGWLGRFPTDVQILDAAKSGVTKVLTEASRPSVKRDEHGAPTVELSQPTKNVKPGFIQVKGACPCCGLFAGIDRENISLGNLLSALTNIPDHADFGDNGRMILTQTPEGPSLGVGYVADNESVFAGWLNDQLAARFGQAITLVEKDVVADIVSTSTQFTNALRDQNDALAKAYGIDR